MNTAVFTLPLAFIGALASLWLVRQRDMRRHEPVADPVPGVVSA